MQITFVPCHHTFLTLSSVCNSPATLPENLVLIEVKQTRKLKATNAKPKAILGNTRLAILTIFKAFSARDNKYDSCAMPFGMILALFANVASIQMLQMRNHIYDLLFLPPRQKPLIQFY